MKLAGKSTAKTPETEEKSSVREWFQKQDIPKIAELYFAVTDTVGGNICVAPVHKRRGPDWNRARGGDYEIPSRDGEPDTFDEIERWFVLVESVAGCSDKSSFMVYWDPLRAGSEVPFVHLLTGDKADAGIGRAVIYRDIGLADIIRWEPVVRGQAPEPANDNDPLDVRQLPTLPKMCVSPLSPEAAGGLLADISRWITETAIVPVPELSMISATALLAGMFGNRLLGPTQSGLNVYITTLLETAGGKGHPPKAIRTLADAAGRPGAATNGDHTSYAALERTLRRNSSTVVTMDEFGITLQDMNGRHSTAPAASIRKFLLAVYDQAGSIFDGRIYASSEAKKDDSPINGPAMTVLGMTTPETLFAGLSESSITDGFINRFVFVTGSAPTSISPPKLVRTNRPPAALVAALKHAQENCPRGDGVALKLSVPFEDDEGGEAYRRWSEIFVWQHSPAWTTTEGNISGRASENTIRLATIRAVSRNPQAPVVSVEDVEWGWAIVHASIALVTAGAEKHMSASPAEALRKAIVEALKEAPEQTMPISRLMRLRGIRGAEQYELAGAFKWLIDAGQIFDLAGRPAPGRGSKLKLISVPTA